MNRYLLIFAILALIALGESRHRPRKCKSRRHRHHCWSGNDQPEIFFKTLSREVIAADRNADNYCKDHKNDVTEIYETENYKLITTLQDTNEEDIIIKIKHRVIFINVEKKETKESNDSSSESKEHNSNAIQFAEVRILPEIVNPAGATWVYNNGNLQITIPYKIVLNQQVSKTCNPDDINDKTKYVPKAAINLNPWQNQLGTNENQFGNNQNQLRPNQNQFLPDPNHFQPGANENNNKDQVQQDINLDQNKM